MKLFCILTTLWISSSALATDWPEKASGLTPTQIERVHERYSYLSIEDLDQFRLRGARTTVPPHGIVTYSFQEQETCPDGSSGPITTYLTLYVEETKVKIATLFTNFYCHED